MSERGNIFGNQPETGMSADRAFDAYGSVGTLFAIVSMIGNAFASTPWHLYRKAPQVEAARRQEVLDHAMVTLWNSPNPFYTGRFFRETVQQHIDLVGEGIIVLYTIGGLPIEMWPVRPDRIHPVKHPTKFLTGYIYKDPDGEEVPLTLDQVIHIKLPNPGDPYRGMGPVQSVLADIDASKYAAEWNRNFFVNGARPGGIIKVDYRMNDNEFREFLQRWQGQHRGVANAHRVAVLENAEWQDTAFSMQDMQFVELRNLPRELIREAFAFPKPMLGSVDDVNRANAKTGEDIFARWQAVPRLDRWKDVVNARLLPRFQNWQKLEFEPDNPVPIDQSSEDVTRNSKSISARNLVLAGYHPSDVAEAMQLPNMRWTGIPQPGQQNTELDQQQNGNNNQPPA
jgi:HK97 family phage portal protein